MHRRRFKPGKILLILAVIIYQKNFYKVVKKAGTRFHKWDIGANTAAPKTALKYLSTMYI